MKRTCTIATALLTGAFIVLAACGGDKSGSSDDKSGGTAATAGHRIEHEDNFNYPTGTTGQHPAITNPAPHTDFPDLDKLDCDTPGVFAAKGILKNTTDTTNDYNLVVMFYVEGQEYLGSEITTTYVQVYEVKPGERVQYATAELEGETHVRSGKTSCRFNKIERRLSGPGSEAPKLSPVCKLLTTAEVAKVANGHVKATSRSETNCGWEDADNTFSFSIVQAKPVQPPSYQMTYPAPCDGTYGLTEDGELVAVCQKDSGSYYITCSAPSEENQTPPATTPPRQKYVDAIGNLIEQAMSRA